MRTAHCGQDRLLHDGQAARGQPVGVGIRALGEHGEGPAAMRATTSSPRTVARRRRPISATTAETISRPAFSRAAAWPSSSMTSRVVG